MKIRKILFENFKGIKTGSISFEDDLTVIVGANGSGKSTVLDAVSISLSWIIARIKSAKGIGAYISEENICNGEKFAELSTTFDQIETLSITNKAISGIAKKRTSYLEKLNEYTDAVQAKIELSNFQTSIPIFAYYGVKRAVIIPPLRAKNREFRLIDAYNEALNGAANFREFFVWFRNQEDLENERQLIQPSLFDDPMSMAQQYPKRELDAFRTALNLFLPEYTNIHIRRNPLRMLIEKSGREYNVSQLSDGEKIYIALIGDLCKRLVIANPTLPNPLVGEGIVLIDEIDLHLHPNWQHEIINRLTSVFPNIQFIVSTHSPHVVNNSPARSLRVLHNEGENIEIQEAPMDSYGQSSLIVLKDIMGLTYDRPEKIERLIDELYELQIQGEVAALKEKYNELNALVPELPELTYFRKVIERKERKSEQ